MKIAIFQLAGKEYGVSIDQVKQVIRMRKVTSIPEAAEFVEGVIALRGKVLPLVNLRKKLGLGAAALDKKSRIIVTQAKGHLVGVIVDSVSDVDELSEEEISPADDILRDASYLKGVIRAGQRLILMVDIEKLLGEDIASDVDKINQSVEVRKSGEAK